MYKYDDFGIENGAFLALNQWHSDYLKECEHIENQRRIEEDGDNWQLAGDETATISDNYDGYIDDLVDSYITSDYAPKKVTFERARLESLGDVFANDVHIFITKKIIRKIASNPKSRSMVACHDIVDSGFSQAIFEDITQEIATTLINFHANDSIFGVVHFKDGAMVFDEYENKKGENVSYYGKLYGVVERVLYDYSNKSAQAEKRTKSVDAIYTSANGKEWGVSIDNASFIGCCGYTDGILDLLMREDFKSFIDFVKAFSGMTYTDEKGKRVVIKPLSKTTSKSFFCTIMGLADGLKNEEIANTYNLAIATVKRRRADIKQYYSLWLANGGKIETHNAHTQQNGCAFGATSPHATRGDYFEDKGKGVKFVSYPPTVGALELNKKTDNDDDNTRYDKDSKVVIRVVGAMVNTYYRSEYTDDDGKTAFVDVFIRETPKK